MYPDTVQPWTCTAQQPTHHGCRMLLVVLSECVVVCAAKES